MPLPLACDASLPSNLSASQWGAMIGQLSASKRTMLPPNFVPKISSMALPRHKGQAADGLHLPFTLCFSRYSCFFVCPCPCCGSGRCWSELPDFGMIFVTDGFHHSKFTHLWGKMLSVGVRFTQTRCANRVQQYSAPGSQHPGSFVAVRQQT